MDRQRGELTAGKLLLFSAEEFGFVNRIGNQSGKLQLEICIGTVFPPEDLHHAAIPDRIMDLLSVPFRPVVFRRFDQRIDITGKADVAQLFSPFQKSAVQVVILIRLRIESVELPDLAAEPAAHSGNHMIRILRSPVQGPVQRQPVVQVQVLQLDTFFLVRLKAAEIALAQGERHGRSLVIQFPAAAGTVVDEQIGKTFPEFLPEKIKSLDEFHFRDPDPVRRIPAGQMSLGFHIEVFPVIVDPLPFDDAADGVQQIFPGFGNADIQQKIDLFSFGKSFLVAKQPFRMFLNDCRTGGGEDPQGRIPA